MAPPDPEPTLPTPLDPEDEDDARPSEGFAEALRAFEGPRPSSRTPEIKVGARVRGKLVSIGEEQSLVDFGGRSEGAIATHLLKDESGSVLHAVGDEMDLFVMSTEDEIVLAPARRADPGQALAQLREAHRDGVPVTGRVTGRNSGGLEVDLAGVRGFCPVSQIELGFCADPAVHVGRTYDFLVTEVREGRGGVVVSRRSLLARAAEEEGRRTLASLKPGAEVEGKVARVEAFGAFVDLGGVDGLVHVSEIRHERTGHPSEVLAVGQTVRVRVLKIEAGKDGRTRVALSMKAAAPDPWTDAARRFPVGSRVSGTVVRLTDFGAFVSLAPGLDGLVHVSEIANRRIAHPKEALAANQSVEAVVLAVDGVKKRVSLSIRKTLDAGPDASTPHDDSRVLFQFFTSKLSLSGWQSRGKITKWHALFEFL